MLGPKKKEQKMLKIISYKSGSIAYEFILNKKKMLLGSFPGSDIIVDDPHVSHYHAFIVVDDDGGKITDLDSENGVYLNNKRVKSSFFSTGDSLKIGNLEFSVEDVVLAKSDEQAQFIDHDMGKVVAVDERIINELPPELPPKDGLVVIDGEYCDIKFAEEEFSPVDKIAAYENDFDFSDYVETDEKSNYETIVRKSNKMAIEVTVMSCGNIISMDYLDFKDKTYYVSPKKSDSNSVLINALKGEDKIPFIKIKNGTIEVLKIDEFVLSGGDIPTQSAFEKKGSTELKQKDVICLSFRTVQIVIKVTQSPPHLKPAPFWGRDREFQLQTTKVFSVLMGLMLLLLFVDITIDPPIKRKIAIIYRKAIQSTKVSKNKSSSNNDSQNKDMGIKKIKTPIKKIKMAKKNNVIKKSTVKKKVKKVVKKTAAPLPKVVKKQKMKKYKFKMKSSLSSLFGAKKSTTKIAKSQTLALAQSFTSVTSASDAKIVKIVNMEVGKMGSDYKGSYDSSSGAQGLASKRGIDTTYMEPKTMVLGSMDPELLRKILREYLPQFRHCYQQELEVSELVEGVVDLNFRINKTGRVGKVRIKTKASRFTKSGVNCMASVLRLIDFPKPKGGGVVDVRQPLNFFSARNKI